MGHSRLRWKGTRTNCSALSPRSCWLTANKKCRPTTSTPQLRPLAPPCPPTMLSFSRRSMKSGQWVIESAGKVGSGAPAAAAAPGAAAAGPGAAAAKKKTTTEEDDGGMAGGGLFGEEGDDY